MHFISIVPVHKQLDLFSYIYKHPNPLHRLYHAITCELTAIYVWSWNSTCKEHETFNNLCRSSMYKYSTFHSCHCYLPQGAAMAVDSVAISSRAPTHFILLPVLLAATAASSGVFLFIPHTFPTGRGRPSLSLVVCINYVLLCSKIQMLQCMASVSNTTGSRSRSWCKWYLLLEP